MTALKNFPVMQTVDNTVSILHFDGIQYLDIKIYDLFEKAFELLLDCAMEFSFWRGGLQKNCHRQDN
jgi:hypothetical protein